MSQIIKWHQHLQPFEFWRLCPPISGTFKYWQIDIHTSYYVAWCVKTRMQTGVKERHTMNAFKVRLHWNLYKPCLFKKCRNQSRRTLPSWESLSKPLYTWLFHFLCEIINEQPPNMILDECISVLHALILCDLPCRLTSDIIRGQILKNLKEFSNENL